MIVKHLAIFVVVVVILFLVVHIEVVIIANIIDNRNISSGMQKSNWAVKLLILRML